MYKIILGLIILLSLKAGGQTTRDTTVKNIQVFYGDRLGSFLDSLKSAIFSDTIKFNPADVYRNGNFVENKKQYSKIYIIQQLKERNSLHYYSYKMDIISQQMVIEFVNQYLNDKVVKTITVDNEPDSSFFPNGTGVLWIDLWETALFKPKIAGLNINKEGNGSNFYIWEK